VDHVTIWRWVQHDAPILNQRLRRELRHPNRFLAGGRNVCPGRRQVGIPLQGS
jgi:hypothetical protein